MKGIYFDLIGGASGDMILGALLDAGVDPDHLRSALDQLLLEEFELKISQVDKAGFQATKVDVVVDRQPPERHLAEILELIERSSLPKSIKKHSSAVFHRIADVEAGIHGTAVEQVHLHELGGTDTVVDVVGVLLALDLLAVDQVYCSPIPQGRGFVQGAHGQIPLPAPATIKLLEGVPVYGLDIQSELVTPTGAALLTSLTENFGPAPLMVLTGVGYGAGSRDLPIPNLLRVLVGELSEGTAAGTALTVLESNLDDLNPEIYPYLMERLFQAGALDVSLIPVHMKKNRPGVQVQVLCEPAQAENLRQILFRETTTLGIREYPVKRYALERRSVAVQTQHGQIRLKVANIPGGGWKASPEFEDCQKLARELDLPLMEIYQAAIDAYQADPRWRS